MTASAGSADASPDLFLPERTPGRPGELFPAVPVGLPLGLPPGFSPADDTAVPPAYAAGIAAPGRALTDRAQDQARDPARDRARNAVPDATRRVLRRTGFTVTADGSYAACLALAQPAHAQGGAGAAGAGTAWFAERWTLEGPEPYAVPLPGSQPEEEGTRAVPLGDGRVLLARRVADRYDLALLHPSGAGTAEVPAGSLPGPEVRMLPPSPARTAAFALGYEGATGDGTADGGARGTGTQAGVRTVLWWVHGTAAGVPERVMTVDGRCTGGVWLDRSGRLLALDRALDGRTKAVAVDLHAGTVSPLLQLTEDSDDRLLLAEPDSGLLVLRSNATGEARLGWGVLGSHRPVRFPDTLCVRGTQLTPVAAQPGQILSPESTVVALRAEVPGGAESLALWRPGERRVHWRASPPGWLGAAGLWLPGGDLRLPYADPAARESGLLAYDLPPQQPPVAPPRLPRRTARVVKEPRRLMPVQRGTAVLPLQQALLPAPVSRA